MLQPARNTLQRNPALIVVLLAALWLALNLASLNRYPPVTCDEAFYARSALRYVEALGAGAWWPEDGLLFYLPHGRTYWLLLGGLLSLTGPSLAAGRLLSVAGWALLTAATWLVGRRYTSPRAAAWAAALTAVTWLGLHTAHRIRPDMLTAAAGTALVGLAHLAREKKQPRLTAALGLALLLALDLHPNAGYITLPLAALTALWLIRDRAARQIIWLALGLLIGLALLVGLHLGPFVGPALRLTLADPRALVASQGVAHDAGGLIPTLVEAIRWLGGFWWTYYAWWGRFVSLPQAVLFAVGLVGGITGQSGDRRALAGLVIASSALFALVNAGYTSPPGYALLWVPLYLVLGTAALDDLARRGPPLPVLGRAWPALLLAALGLSYLAGGAALVLRQPPRSYAAAADPIAAHITPGARVLASSVWWYALHDDATFLDETLLAPPNSGLWWNSVPADAPPGFDRLALVVSNDLSPDAAAARVATELPASLRPDIVIDDGRIGCQDEPTPLSEALSAFVAASCRRVDELAAGGYGTQTIYACAWP